MSGVKAYVFAVAPKSEFTDETTNVLMIRYTSSGTGTSVFAAAETLTCSNTSLPNPVAYSTSPTGLGSIFTIDEGVVFSRGYFVAFQKQNIILDPTDSAPTCKVGFLSTPSIVTSVDDETLLDNAQGSYNYAAPGADRLKLVPSRKRVS